MNKCSDRGCAIAGFLWFFSLCLQLFKSYARPRVWKKFRPTRLHTYCACATVFAPTATVVRKKFPCNIGDAEKICNNIFNMPILVKRHEPDIFTWCCWIPGWLNVRNQNVDSVLMLSPLPAWLHCTWELTVISICTFVASNPCSLNELLITAAILNLYQAKKKSCSEKCILKEKIHSKCWPCRCKKTGWCAEVEVNSFSAGLLVTPPNFAWLRRNKHNVTNNPTLSVLTRTCAYHSRNLGGGIGDS